MGEFDGVKQVARGDVYLLWDGDTTGYPVDANDTRITWNWNLTVLRCIQAGVPAAGRPEIRQTAGEPADEIRQGSAIWSVESNVLPIRALQITIRFMHPSTDEPRQIIYDRVCDFQIMKLWAVLGAPSENNGRLGMYALDWPKFRLDDGTLDATRYLHRCLPRLRVDMLSINNRDLDVLDKDAEWTW